MLVTYYSFVVMRMRRETDDQTRAINLNRMLREMEERPEVVPRDRYMRMLNLPAGAVLIEVNEDYFVQTWADGSGEVLDPARVAADRDALQKSVDRVQDVANTSIAHRQQIEVRELTFGEVDQGFDALEGCLSKYYTLLHGATLIGLEPAPQFDTHEVYTFPWLTRNGR